MKVVLVIYSTLRRAQTFPQKFQDDNFVADLKGTLMSGSVTKENDKVRLKFDIKAEGTVKLVILPIYVTGTVATDAVSK